MRPTDRNVFLLVLVIALAACQHMPTSTRNGDVREIRISDSFATDIVEVSVGEEIRWINTHAGTVRIVFIDRISDQMSCRRNFCGYFTGGAEAFLKSNQSASLCFRDPGTIHYTVERLPSGSPAKLTGQIRITSSTSQR